jgi:acyl-CoA dehydrogenase
MNIFVNEEDQLFLEMTRKWVNNEIPKDWCRKLECMEHQFPHEFWDKLVEFGAHGIGISEEYGGQGGSILNQALFARELSRTAGGLSWVWGVTSFSGAKAINFCGSKAQKEMYLPKIASGEIKTAMSFSEPSGGTDLLGGMKTTAKKVDGGWLINGEKIWSTCANVADYLFTMARSSIEVNKRSDGISIFFIPANSKGITVTELPKLGMRAVSSCSVFFDDVFVADEHLLGEEGNGWYQSTKTLNNERLINAATCLGMLDAVLEDAVDHMKTRHAFGKPIGQFQALQHYIADISMWQKQGELMVLHTATLQANNIDSALESNMAKVICSEAVGKSADLGIQILGGMGYSAETDMQRYWRDSRLLRIGPVSNEMARNMIAESYGLPRSF